VITQKKGIRNIPHNSSHSQICTQGGISAHDQWGDNYSNLQWGGINIPAGMGRTNAVGRMTKIRGGKVEINEYLN